MLARTRQTGNASRESTDRVRRMGRTVSHITSWELAGEPVQPAYCSSPAERTGMGLSRVPACAIFCQPPSR